MNNYQEEDFDKVCCLADFVAKTWDPKMKWMWGEGLLGYALDELDKECGGQKYTEFLTQYCRYYVKNQPRVSSSDTAAPGLITYAMQKRTGDPECAKLTAKVLNYIRDEPRLIGDALNHLGSSLVGKIYPKSVWVDSLMMFAVFTSLYAKETGDAELLDFAARQPEQYARYMMDGEDNLWYHCYWVKAATHYPKRKIYWGRGNGWVVSALPMILDNIGSHGKAPGILEIFRKTCAALLPYQRSDGAFETVFNKKSKTYRELSFTALVANGFMHGVRKGYLDKRFLEPGLKAYKAAIDALEFEEGRVYMPEVSGPTIPLPIFPYAGYKLVPRGKNWSYGIAALVFAAINYRRLK
jgi:unsaturated rhamnogalacturonyl hydrolase